MFKSEWGLDSCTGKMDLAGVLIQADVLQLHKLELPWFRGQVDRSHAMTLRLSIDDQPNQDKAPVHGPAEAGGHCALPQ